MKIGNRIYYNKFDGKIIFQTGEMEGNVLVRVKEEIDYIDLPFGDKTLKGALEFHIENKEIVIDKYIERQETEEEKLRREKEELENQLLLKENRDLGGIL